MAALGGVGVVRVGVVDPVADVADGDEGADQGGRVERAVHHLLEANRRQGQKEQKQQREQICKIPFFRPAKLITWLTRKY